MKTFKNLYLTDRFFYALAAFVVLFVVTFLIKWLFYPMIALLMAFTMISIYDIFQLFWLKHNVTAMRKVSDVMSLGEDNNVMIEMQNHAKIFLKVEIIDELPFQFQKRDFYMLEVFSPLQRKILTYQLRPTTRGEYLFGNINLYLSSTIGLINHRQIITAERKVAVYPSTVLMKKFGLFSAHHHTSGLGLRKMRRIGQSYEFDNIRSYVSGDDPRSINWKASGRRSQLMVNNYIDEKAQQIYCLLDKSRAMQMPFDGLTLLDHAINTSLMIANTALQKNDKSGLISFSNKIGSVIKAGTGKRQLHQIYNALYREKENQYEADYELMYNAIRRLLGGRSLLLLFTNFESVYAMERVLPVLRQLNRMHLLVVILFKNSAVNELAVASANNITDIYTKTIARKFLLEKELIIRELQKHKIQVVFTSPNELPANTINKYMELKARGLI